MNFYNAINIVSILIWFLPLLKQKGTEYLPFFILLSISDPLGFLFMWLFKFSAAKFYLIVLALQLAVLYKGRGKIKVIGILLAVTLIIVFFLKGRETLYFIESVYMITVTFFLLWHFSKMLIKNKINVFLVFLILYYSINFFRFVAIALSFYQGSVSFYVGFIIQIGFGILFTFINIDSKNINLNRKDVQTDY